VVEIADGLMQRLPDRVHTRLNLMRADVVTPVPAETGR
jgi:hypothetical protein